MRFLVDTHLLICLANDLRRLSRNARKLLEDTSNELVFSAVSMWEISIKRALGRPDFEIDSRILRRDLLDRQWGELPLTSEHGFAAGNLPPIHRDPFDRALIAQAIVDGVMFLTGDARLARYPGPVWLV